MRPVTQVAEVAVKRAFRKGVKTPARLKTGRVRRKAPRRISSRKLPTIRREGFWSRRFSFISMSMGCLGFKADTSDPKNGRFLKL